MNIVSNEELRERLSLSLSQKVLHSLDVISSFYHNKNGKCYVSFSGGKDSTVLLHIVRRLYPDIPVVFINTRNEYPEIYRFVRMFDNITWIKPKYKLKDIVEKYGFPLISKEQALYIHEIRHTKSEYLRNIRLTGGEGNSGKISKKWQYLVDAPFSISDVCCTYLKKEPARLYEKETERRPFIGTLVSESQLRKQKYLKTGCNDYISKRHASYPLSIWTTNDIWEYIHKFNVSYCSIYQDNDIKQTGCMFCGFGCHYKTDMRFENLKLNYPLVYKYCMGLKNNNITYEEAIEVVRKGSLESLRNRSI